VGDAESKRRREAFGCISEEATCLCTSQAVFVLKFKYHLWVCHKSNTTINTTNNEATTLFITSPFCSNPYITTL